MSQNTQTPGRVSSPASTGGAGTFFEQHVSAYWLAQLLVRGIPPILHDCTVMEVHFQTERLGWNTDDFLVVGENGSKTLRKLAGQVKRTFTVSTTDEECKKAIQDFWKDFNSPQRFTPATDRLALVTLRGTIILLEHFSGLLDCARAARDAAEFESRLTTPGLLSNKVVAYCADIRTIISETEGQPISAARIWPFLRVLHVLSLDLNSSTGQTEAAIKTLLAHTTNEPDALGVAEASWNALLAEVGEGMPEARTYRRDDLPEALRQRHSPVSGAGPRALQALSDHSAIILDGIHSTIGKDLHLGREPLVQRIIEQMELTQLVLVSGVAGSGKSGIAKDVVGILAADHFAFSFRAEEFASPHFDETLQRNQIPANAAVLGALLAAQGRKVLLVESVERLLEASTRDAFTDLLTLVAKDRSWQLVLTCRDYSVDLVCTGLLEAQGVGYSVVTVPPLDDAELQQVEAEYPTLARPLANAALRGLLRNPYVLDKALQIAWSEDRPLPQSEREFRTRFWQEIIRVDHRAASGMPRRREEAFVQVALRRARVLTLYAPCGNLDPEVITSLRGDSLIVSSLKSTVLVAPAHDVLEDWAILHWIEEQHATLDGSVRKLSNVLGTQPAIRRTYRKWVGELVEWDAAAADSLFQAVMHEPGLPAQFRDDTLVSLLRSAASTAFLERHSAELFANDKQLLRRVIHLLRVACVTTPAWRETTAAHASLFHVPEGLAWACVLRLVQGKLSSFTAGDCALLLGLIEDWSRGVSSHCPYPEGAKSVAAIAHWLLPNIDDYQSKDQRKRTLEVIAKIPKADRNRFADLLQGVRDDGKRDQAAIEFRKIIFVGPAGMPAGRDMAKVVIVAARGYLLCREADLQQEWGGGGHLDLETLFGIKPGRSHDYFPASACRGPFFPLLHDHPREGLALMIEVFNHSADWYAHPRVQSDYVEPPFEMVLTFADGSSRTQWCNDRLWLLYRGMSVGPYVLQSLLMALERWLLGFAEEHEEEVDTVLLHILKQSDSAAVTSVVASVATAFPQASGETLLVLLRSPLCILLDRDRWARESQLPSQMRGLIPQLDGRNKIYKEERKEADDRPHRRCDLEMAVANLQLGPLAPRVHEILDQHRADMPAVEEQEEEDRLWRLALHRMDLRQYTISTEQAQLPVAKETDRPANDSYPSVRLKLNAPEADVKEMVEQNTVQFQDMNARLNLLMWGMNTFKREAGATYDSGQWRQRLAQAQAARVSGGDKHEQGEGGPGYVAAVCIRDRWEEMTQDERDWCVNLACSEVEREANRWNQLARVQRFDMAADRPCAWVLPVLVGRCVPAAQQSRIRQVLVIALTHAIDEVRWYAAWGVGENLWTIDRDLAVRCVSTLATESRLLEQAIDEERARLLGEREFAQFHSEGWLHRIAGKVASQVRQQFHEADGISHDAIRTFDPSKWYGAQANGHIMTILERAPTESIAITAFQRLANILVGWWDADRNHLANADEQQDRHHEAESALTVLLERFLLRTPLAAATTILQPILDAVDRHPHEVHWLLRGFIEAEARQPNTPQFWSLWMLFADKVRCADWLSEIDCEHVSGPEMVYAIFLGASWKDEIRHWRSLEGYAGHVHSLFEDLPPSSTVLDDYLRFLYHIGEQSLPGAFTRIAKRLQQGDPVQMLKKGNTVFLLEALLQRHVYGRPLELKRNSDLRDAILLLLDLLVEQGSSAAFRMRDDFVTPVAIP
jgi:hypothetical protein